MREWARRRGARDDERVLVAETFRPDRKTLAEASHSLIEQLAEDARAESRAVYPVQFMTYLSSSLSCPASCGTSPTNTPETLLAPSQSTLSKSDASQIQYGRLASGEVNWCSRLQTNALLKAAHSRCRRPSSARTAELLCFTFADVWLHRRRPVGIDHANQTHHSGRRRGV